MKDSFVILAALALTSIPALATARSFEELAAAQVQEVISPVTLNGKSMIGAASVCSAMGFKRLVEFSVEPCTPGEPIYAFMSDGGEGAPEFLQRREGCNSVQRWRLKSVTCAK